MEIPLRILIVEDRATDAELMLHELQQAGLVVDGRRVETEADFVAALEPALDLILADYSLPQFTGLRALQLLHEHQLDIPFIIVTGSVGEEVAVECMKRGAADYLLKDRMARLGQSVTHTLEQKRLRAENRRAAEALRTSERKYRKLHESMIDGFGFVDMEGHIIDSNSSYQQMLGYTFEELTHLTYRDLTPEKWHAAEQTIVDEQVLPRGYSDIYQKEYRRKDGTVFPIEIHTFLIKNEAGENEGMWAIVRDITERQQAEQAIRESERRERERATELQTIMDAVPAFIWIAHDQSGQWITGNRALYELLHMPPQSNVSISAPEDQRPAHFKIFIDGNDLPRHDLPIQLSAMTGIEVRDFEEDIVFDDGRVIHELGNVVSLFDEQGRPRGAVAAFIDITARKQAEEALRESQRQLSTLMSNLPGMAYRCKNDVDRTMEFVSEGCQALTGYESRQIQTSQGIAYADLIHPDDREMVWNTVQVGLQAKQSFHMEYRIRTARGAVKWIWEQGQAVYTAAGEFTALEGFITDITERKQAEEQLRNAERFAHATIDALSAHLCVLDENGVILTVNQAWHDFAQANPPVPSHHFLGANYLEVCDAAAGPDSAEAAPFAAGLRAVMRGDLDQFALEYPCHAPHEKRWFIGRVTRFLGDGPLRIVIVHEDITERKQAETALQDSEKKFRSVIEQSGDGIVLTDEHGVIIEWNLAEEAITGRRRAEAVGRPLWEVQFESAPEERQDPAIYEQIVATLLEFYRTGRAPWLEQLQTSLIKRPDGTRLYLEVVVFAIETAQGFMAAGFSRDVTQRKRMEQALHDKVVALQTLSEVDREIMAATEPQRILDLVCHRAAELAHVPKSAIATMTAIASDMTIAATFGMRDPVRVRAEVEQAWRSGSMSHTIVTRRETVSVSDVHAAGRRMPDIGAGEEICALALFPLIAGEKALGALGVFDTTPHEWQADELQVLGLLAAQAALALEKLRLSDADRNRAAQLAMLNEIGQAITSSLDLDLVLVTLLDKVRRAADAEACSVALVDLSTGELVLRQAVGGSSQFVIGKHFQPGEGIAGWALQHRQAARVADVTTDARFYALPGSDYVVRDLVCVPLLARDTAIGVLELINKRRATFSEEDVHLLESVAAQAAIVIENARLFETEHTARERLETLYRIGQAVNSILEADTILDRLTDEAMRATQASHGSALVAHPELGYFERRSLRGYSAEQAEKARTDRLPLDRGVNGRAYRRQQPVYVDDVQDDPDYHPLIPTTRSELAVPIVRGGQVIGNLDLQSPVANAFHHIDLQFLQALTDQVAIALENARLFEETHRQMDELTIVTQVALVGAAGRPFDETVARATDALSRLWPEAALGFLFVDETGQALRMHSSYLNPTPVLVAMESLGLDQGLTGWAARQQRPIRVGDVTTDPRYLAHNMNIRSSMVAPLVVGTQLIGVVNVETPAPDAFSGDDLRLLTTLAGQLAVIFEKARLDSVLIEHTAHLEQRVQERTAEIRREHAQTQAILDALSEGVVVTDLQGTIQYVNRAMEQVTGFSAQESLGQNPRLWQSGQTPLVVYQEMWAAVLAGRRWRAEIVNQRKDGERYFASLALAPIPTTTNSGEPFAGLVGVQRDVTERKRAEEEMQRALEKERELNNLKSNFVSLTSHEFRTPLTTILSSAEMLEHYGARWTAERRQEHLQRIQTAVKYMTGLLNDILVVAKAEASRLEFSPAPLDLLKFCRDLVEEIQLADKAQHTLIFDGKVNCAQASMDEQLLRHIFSNLLSNALKYSPPGGVVQFDLTCQAGQAVFRIQDHGLGIPLEDQARLFETFHRASNVRSIPGTGLGLTIVKRSVEVHGGTIEIVSQIEVGTTVTVSLPIGMPDQG
jgi:PAS domain S-box-containing protein